MKKCCISSNESSTPLLNMVLVYQIIYFILFFTKLCVDVLRLQSKTGVRLRKRQQTNRVMQMCRGLIFANAAFFHIYMFFESSFINLGNNISGTSVWLAIMPYTA